MAVQPWRTAKVIKITDEASDTKRYWLQVPDLEEFDFIPGQFVTLDLPIHERPAKRWRSYSIASWPDKTNIFELVIVLDKTGVGTPWLFNNALEGSELSFRGPQGVFILKQPIEKDLFLICTGTGVAPFRSMVHHIRNHSIPFKNIYLIFGCRRKDNILYYDELKGLAKELPNFQYIPTLSREEWDGRCGYVHPIYEELCREKPDAEFFLCGWKNMINEARQRIMAMGYDRKAVHQELYG